MGCGCRKASSATKGAVSQPTSTVRAGVGIEFEVRQPGAESEYFPTRPKANEFARGKNGATIHRVTARQTQETAA